MQCSVLKLFLCLRHDSECITYDGWEERLQNDQFCVEWDTSYLDQSSIKYAK